MHRYNESEINLVYEDVLLRGIRVYTRFDNIFAEKLI